MDKKEKYIGLDLHKRTSSLCVKTKEGILLQKAKIKTVWEEFEKVLSPFRGSHIVFEPVSQSWWIGEKLEESLQMKIHLAHAREVKAIAFAKVKNDAIDAEVLCDLLRNDFLPEGYLSNKEEREQKELVRFRTSLIGMRLQLKLKIHALLSRQGIIPEMVNIFGPKGREWQKGLLLRETTRLHLEEYLDLISLYEKKIMKATQEIEKKVTENDQAKLLMTIPGISYVSALTILSEIGDIKRFRNGKKLSSFAGLVPSTYASGEKVRHGKITKKGSKWLRTILVEAAHRQGRLVRVRGLRVFYDRMKKDHGVGTAVVATARKLCHIIYGVLHSQTPFDDSRMVSV